MNETVAALDAGTNTFRIFIASMDDAGCLKEHVKQLRFVGLGQGVDETRRFDQGAIERGLDALREFAPMIREYGCTKARFVATSASRDAENRDDFFVPAERILGFAPELISGEEEAQLSFNGVLSSVKECVDPVLVVDSGGGSTELVLGDASGKIFEKISLNIGSRRIRERFLHSDRPTKEQLDAANEEISRQLDDLSWLTDVNTFICVAGTVTSMAALDLGLQSYDRSRVHRSSHEVDNLLRISKELNEMTSDQIAALGPVAPQRAKVLGAGSLIVAQLARKVGKPLIASESDLLDGLALAMLS